MLHALLQGQLENIGTLGRSNFGVNHIYNLGNGLTRSKFSGPGHLTQNPNRSAPMFSRIYIVKVDGYKAVFRMTEANVTAADQMQINKFARLHLNVLQLEVDMAGIQNDLQNINEAADELLLLDGEDGDAIPFKYGQTFVHFSSDAMTEKLDKLKEETEEKLQMKKDESAASQSEMAVMKEYLKDKFGDRINLEVEKDD